MKIVKTYIYHISTSFTVPNSDNDKEEEQEALFSKATGLTGKTAEHGYWLRISDEGEVLR